MQAPGRGGVPQDMDAARKTLEEVCSSDQWDACVNLAWLVTSFPKPDFVRAREVLTRACDGKFAPACERLKTLPKEQRR
jgi:TPR repeat protein